MNRIIDILNKAAKAGHTFMTVNEILSHFEEEETDNILIDLQYGIDTNVFVEFQRNIYLSENYNYETICSFLLFSRLYTGYKVDSDSVDSVIFNVESEMKIFFDVDQRNAIKTALTNGLTLITGGAGSGKTTLIKALLEANKAARGNETLVCAPTKRACKQVKKRTGIDAQTIHRALNIRDNQGFLNASYEDRIHWKKYSMIIVDEASMLTMEMFAGLLSHIHSDCALVLIGDPNQLPGIGAGRVLNDLEKIDLPHITLTGNYRQLQYNSALVTNLFNLANHTGALPAYDNTFRFVEAETSIDAQDTIIALKATMDNANMESQVITPVRKLGMVGAACLNLMMQEILNPSDEDRHECGLYPTVFRNGDPVILKQNDGAFCSGDIGLIHITDKTGTEVSIEVDINETRKRWSESDIYNKFDLGYATTVYKAQGSEYDHVILVIPNGLDHLLTTNLLYTAISRAKKSVTVVGKRKTFEKAFCSRPCKCNSDFAPKTLNLDSSLCYYDKSLSPL